MKNLFKKFNYDLAFYLFCLLRFVLRLAEVWRLPLTGDEAYYRVWSLHPAWGYYDHPPMISWWIWLSTHLFGDNAGAVRFFSILAGALTPLIFYAALKRLKLSREAAFWGGLLLLAAPFLNVYFFIIYPDSPLLLFWCLTLYQLARLRENDEHDLDWLLLGVFLAFTLLSKLNGLLLVLGLGIYWLLDPPRNPKKLGWALLSFLSLTLPYLLWNIDNRFAPFQFQLYNRHQMPNCGLETKHVVSFWLQQVAVFNPVIFGLLLWAVWRALVKPEPELQSARLLGLCLFFPTFLTFALFSFRESVQPNWLLSNFLSAFLLIALLYQNRPGRALKIWLGVGLILSLLLSGVVNYALVHPRMLFKISQNHAGAEYRGNNLTEIFAYQPLGRDLAVLKKQAFPGEQAFVCTESYQLASLLTYYSGDFVYVVSDGLNGREYRNWQDLSRLEGQSGLFIDITPLEQRPDAQKVLRRHFRHLEPLKPMIYHYQGHLARYFYPVRCSGFKFSESEDGNRKELQTTH